MPGGITIASLGLGAPGEPAVATLITPLLGSFLSEGIIHTVAFAVAFGIITFLHITYGELTSKSFAVAKPEGTSQVVAPFMKFSSWTASVRESDGRRVGELMRIVGDDQGPLLGSRGGRYSRSATSVRSSRSA